jgi:ketosteroid isomerase-like protein
MAELTNREIVERFVQAQASRDPGLGDEYIAEDVVEDYPQSGERIRGRANRNAIFENYPGRAEHDFGSAHVRTVVGEDQWVMTPTLSLLRINGAGERYTGTGLITYPNGEVWHLVQLIEMRGGKIAKLITYFAAPFEAPAWRAKWVERTPDPAVSATATPPPRA